MRRLLVLLLTPLAAWAASPSAANASAWVWPLPLPHHVVRGFDPPPQPWLPGHRGVDLAGHAGEAVLAAGAGIVSFAGRVARMPVVSVRHPDGLLTTYQPVRATVAAGDRVGVGQQIGRLVSAGSHCAPAACLHWGLRRGADYLDPLALLHLNQVRLLPLYSTGHPPGWMPQGAAGAGLGSVAGAGASAVATRRRRRRPS